MAEYPLILCGLKMFTLEREYSVEDLLTTQLQEDSELPRRVLLLGRPESGKTALFALILHYWLHGKDRMQGLNDFHLLLAVQCLGLESLSSDSKTAVDLEKHMLDHLPESIKEHGMEVVRQTMRNAKVLIMIDSLDCLENRVLDEDTSLVPWTNSRVILFCQYKFMKERPSHPFHCDQSKENLVLKLWGGSSVNQFESSGNTPEYISELGGVFSGKLLKDYCNRLCKCRNIDPDKFWNYYNEILKYLSLEMRKPFNIYMAMEAFSNHMDFDSKTPSELYSKWFDIWTTIYRRVHDSDTTDISIEGASFLTRLANKNFTEERKYLSHKDSHEKPEMVPFLTHFLMPHYNPQSKIEKFTFRIAAHKLFLVAKQLATEIDLGVGNVRDILRDENFKRLESLVLMILGVARGSNHYEDIKERALKIAKLNLEDHVTKPFRDPIINYAVTLLSETRLFSKDNGFDPFVKKLTDCLRDNNWSIVDGNMHPEALKTLCECGHDSRDPKPQRLNIILFGLPSDMPGLHDILRAVKNCDMRINFSNDCSFLSETGEFSFDEAISALQDKGGASLTKRRGASLASFSGYLQCGRNRVGDQLLDCSS